MAFLAIAILFVAWLWRPLAGQQLLLQANDCLAMQPARLCKASVVWLGSMMLMGLAD